MNIPNTTSPEGIEFGGHLARFAEAAIAKRGGPDERCATCAFRQGTHLANGSAPTLMNAFKSLIEGEAFHCHEHEAVCAGYAALAKRSGQPRGAAPWDFTEVHD